MSLYYVVVYVRSCSRLPACLGSKNSSRKKFVSSLFVKSEHLTDKNLGKSNRHWDLHVTTAEYNLLDSPSGSTVASTNPIFLALTGFMFLPVRAISNALGTDTIVGRRWVPPAPGSRPNMTSGNARFVFVLFTAIL